jgi:hypothetical protein
MPQEQGLQRRFCSQRHPRYNNLAPCLPKVRPRVLRGSHSDDTSDLNGEWSAAVLLAEAILTLYPEMPQAPPVAPTRPRRLAQG